MTAREALRQGIDALRAAGLPEAEADARALVLGVLDWTPQTWLTQADDSLLPQQLTLLRQAFARRAAGQPVQYALGWWTFGPLRLRCDARALIPRPETELVALQAVACLQGLSRPRVADVGCGTGCLGLYVAQARPDAQVTLLDVSPEALALAQDNARGLGLPVRLREQDLACPLWDGPYDLIVSNPPYIPTGDLAGLQPEVRLEPRLALDGGPDGLDCYRHLARRLQDSLRPGGALVLEVGIGQAEAVAGLLRPHCSRVAIQPDLSGIPRVVTGWREERASEGVKR